MRLPVLTPALAALIAIGVAGCGSNAPEQAAPPAAPAKTVDRSTAGSIAGKITLTGTAPAAERIKMSSDPACVENAGPNPQSDAVLVGADGGLQNAFVYIKAGLDAGYGFDTPTELAVLDQKGCHYSPRVLGIRVNQPLTISNADGTFHNVHALPKTNLEFNQGLMNRGDHMSKTFTAPEVMVRFKCDVHGWMAAYVGVMAHPYFAVTAADGSFKLENVPPGKYTVEAWHERFGVQTAEVTVADAQGQTVSLAFKTN